MGSPSSFRRKRPFISLNSSASIENLSSSQRARARARANHAKNDAQKGCAMQLNGITLRDSRYIGKKPVKNCLNARAKMTSDKFDDERLLARKTNENKMKNG